MCRPVNSETWHIDNPGIFITLTYLKPDTYSQSFQRFKFECFPKIVKSHNYFFKTLYVKAFYVKFYVDGVLNTPIFQWVLMNLSSDLALFIIWDKFRTLFTTLINKIRSDLKPPETSWNHLKSNKNYVKPPETIWNQPYYSILYLK